ncbi:hypothetical protein B0H12DRAFT_272982 [Mycena haematopus]|nr:hypothetical protein B0H12DRAFT_272982 [Mycena haematopus]
MIPFRPLTNLARRSAQSPSRSARLPSSALDYASTMLGFAPSRRSLIGFFPLISILDEARQECDAFGRKCIPTRRVPIALVYHGVFAFDEHYLPSTFDTPLPHPSAGAGAGVEREIIGARQSSCCPGMRLRADDARSPLQARTLICED